MVSGEKMKKVYILFTSMFFAVLIFFTFFGKEVYNRVNAHVEAVTVSVYYIVDNKLYYQIPKTALLDDEYVYVIITEQGFSMKISTIEKRKIEIAKNMKEFVDDNYIYVILGLKAGEKIVKDTDSEFENGQKVIVE